MLVAEALLEGVGGVDPLQGVRELGGLSAAGDEVAAGVHDGVGSPGLAGQGGSHRLVEQGRALLPAPLLDQGGPQLDEGAQLGSASPYRPAASRASVAHRSAATASALSWARNSATQPASGASPASSTMRAARASQPRATAVRPRLAR